MAEHCWMEVQLMHYESKDMAEYEAAMEVEVELAQGKVVLRQLPWS